MVELGWLITIYFSLFIRRALRYQGTTMEHRTQAMVGSIHSPDIHEYAYKGSQFALLHL
jgi:hypothetical protein